MGKAGAATLILLNGPPGVGKTTLARRLVSDCPLALFVDIDSIRSSLGQWESAKESKALARDLGVALAETHLRAGYDVIVPQLLGRTEFIERLEAVTGQVGARFVEVMLMCTPAEVTHRFLQRRKGFHASGLAHPEAQLVGTEDEMASTITFLNLVAAARSSTVTVSASGEEDDAYGRLVDCLERTGFTCAAPR